MAGIFICYRRADAEGWAGRLSDSFTRELGRVNIFRDIEDIPPGVEFDSYINNAVGSCDVLIALIGPHWLTVKDKNGARRIDEPEDFTRMEIVTALKRNVRVIPALVGGAKTPDIDELPDELKPLARRQSYELSDSRWVDDCKKLADVLKPIIKQESWFSTKIAKAFFVSLLVLITLGGGKLWYDHNTKKEDTLRLKSISPSLESTLEGSKPINFQIDLNYELASAKEAVLSLGSLIYPQSAGGCSGKYEGANRIQTVRIAEGKSDVSFDYAPGTFPEGGYLNFSAYFLDAEEYYKRGSKREIKKFEEFKAYCYKILPDKQKEAIVDTKPENITTDTENLSDTNTQNGSEVPLSNIETPPKSRAINLISAENGGNLQVANKPYWVDTIDGNEEPDCIGDCIGILGNEEVFAVYSFKNEQSATFDMFTMLIKETNDHNIKKFKLEAGSDSPTGTFKPIGTFTTTNARLLQTPYQEFSFEPVTAKYFRIKVISAHGASLPVAYEFKLYGTYSSNGSEVPLSNIETPPKSRAINLISAENGGNLQVANKPYWVDTIDGNEEPDCIGDCIGILGNEEVFAVYSFKNEQSATFDMFTMLIKETNDHNIKKFKLEAGSDSPTGTFKPIGTFTTTNARLLQTPYQEFSFEPVTAKYLGLR